MSRIKEYSDEKGVRCCESGARAKCNSSSDNNNALYVAATSLC